MKKLLTTLFVICSVAVSAQYPATQTIGSDSTLVKPKGALQGRLINWAYPDTTQANKERISEYPGAQIVVGNTIWLRDSTANRWIKAGSYVNGTAITSLPSIGFVPNTNDVGEWINNVFYQSQPPTATLTGGQTLEYQSAATLNKTLNWVAGRQSATNPISTIVVAGTNETFSQPAQGSSVSGTQSVSFPANTDITYQNVVTTNDGKTATATTSFSFLPKRYFGWISDTTGIGTTGFDDSKITSLGNELSASKIKSWSTGTPTGTQFYVYAYYATAGDLTHFDMNGFPSIEAMNHVTRNFTNALGFTGQWIIYWSKNGQTLSSTIVAN